MLRTILAAAIALSLAGTAVAQQPQSQLRRSAETVLAKYLTAFNTADGRALKNLYAQPAVTLNGSGISAVDQTWGSMERILASGIKLQGSLQDAQQIDADTVLAYGTYHLSDPNGPEGGQGTWMQVLKRQGYDWKIRAMALVAKSEPDTAPSGSSVR